MKCTIKIFKYMLVLILLKIDSPSLWGTTLNGCHLHKIIDTIATYFSYDVKTRVDISMDDVTFFSSE